MFKILNWNVYDNNKKLNNVIKFINAVDADVITLQEVSPSLVKLLKNLSHYNLITADDFYKHSFFGPNKIHSLALLTKVAPKRSIIQNFQVVPQSFFNKLTGSEESKQFINCKLRVKDTDINILNLHLPVYSGISKRISLFTQCIDNIENEKDSSLICGDFNIFANKYINPFVGWMLGFDKQDYVNSEREVFEDIFKTLKFKNVFRKKKTFWNITQLDHILVPENIKVADFSVSSHKYGSDHHPIILTLDL